MQQQNGISKKYKYIARHNRVWQHIPTGKIYGRTISLDKAIELRSYREIEEPARAKEKKRRTEQRAESEPKGTHGADKGKRP